MSSTNLKTPKQLNKTSLIFLNYIYYYIINSMSIREFIDSLKSKKKSEIKSLYKQPVPEVKGEMPRAQVFVKNVYHQGDILYLPDDGDFKFLLVVVDMYDGAVDAEPVKEILHKDNDVLKAFKAIYSRNYLDFPDIITLDQGSEFTQQPVKDYFEKNRVYIKYALAGRSRQLANVERMNQRIGSILLKRMANQELITGEKSKEWVSDIKELIEVLNERKKKSILHKEISPDPIVDDYTGKLLTIGQKVRLKLDKPIDTVKGKRLNGDFRSSDIKWSMKVYKITQVLLKPGFPPLYLTDANDNVGRTKNQLQKVSKKDEEPDARFIRGTPEHYLISKILDKKIENRKTYYLVKWKGYKDADNTWEATQTFDRTNDLKEMRRKFNETH